ncbi:DNA-dependent helicase II, partial [Pasteurella multocida subsp. multocida str. Anand1_cattle]
MTRAMNQQKVGSVAPSLQESEWKMGQKVLHSKFGQGTIINVEGAENNTRL